MHTQIHFVTDFNEHLKKAGVSTYQAVVSAFEDITRPICLSALTTALGFSALCFSDISSIKTFGMFASIGSLIACLSSLTLVPACLSLLRVTEVKPESPNWKLATSWLTSFSARYQRSMLVAGLLIVIAALLMPAR